ncbi:phytoene desaturase [Mesorhizobium soli]|uniref:phytoene desaturase family protein n=1 Tax=Pseudaminobacter soli (ex Li et al. 2025) TaxID=1295366 RepID=UPI002476A5AD|nr:NAD(P)/FAD-dependent oxidoreductase [Mesorhizobium soli]MDH6231906.1 phytoene desaturase [Mesorhizobium soli]
MHDAVVIGAGHNGLAAAIHLATRGWKVAVVEQATEPGGAVKTREVTLPGFRHDLCAMNLSMFAGSAFFAAYKHELTAHGLELVPAPNAFASAFPDGSWLGVSASLEETASRIAKISPRDAEAWRQMVAGFDTQAPHLFGLLGAEMPSLQTAKTAWKAWRAMGTGGLFDMGRMLLSTPRDFLDAHFENDKLKAMMAAWGLHLDFAPDTAGGALFPYLESMASQAFGMVIGKGGADTIIRAMTSLLKAKGGEILLGTAVDAIETDGTRATGVRLADGRTLKASRAVIANAHPKLVFGKLLPSDPARAAFDKRVAGFRAGPGTMMIHLALDSLPDWKAGPELHRFAYVHLAPDMGLMARTYAEAAAGLLPREPVLVVGQPTAVDPSRAPGGKHVLWVQVRVLPADILGDAAGTITALSWDDAKEAYAERALDLLDGYAPGIRSRILERSVFTPRDLEHENPNLIGGDNLSGSHRLDQNFLFRPVPGWSRYKTPVEKLYLCGAATWPGAGTGAGSGFMLGRKLGGK